MANEQLLREWVRNGFGGGDIKREVSVHREWGDPNRPDSERWSGVRHERDALLVGMNNTRIRLRYPKGTNSGVKYIDSPSQTLQQLTALWICNLIPSGVLADCLTEEVPQHEQAATILREWERVKGLEVKP